MTSQSNWQFSVVLSRSLTLFLISSLGMVGLHMGHSLRIGTALREVMEILWKRLMPLGPTHSGRIFSVLPAVWKLLTDNQIPHIWEKLSKVPEMTPKQWNLLTKVNIQEEAICFTCPVSYLLSQRGRKAKIRLLRSTTIISDEITFWEGENSVCYIASASNIDVIALTLQYVQRY